MDMEWSRNGGLIVWRSWQTLSLVGWGLESGTFLVDFDFYHFLVDAYKLCVLASLGDVM